MTGVALFVGLREKRIRRKIIGKKTLKANTRNMYFMFASGCLGGFGRRSPFEGCCWKYSADNLAIAEALFGGVLINYLTFGPQEIQSSVALNHDTTRAFARVFRGHDK